MDILNLSSHLWLEQRSMLEDLAWKRTGDAVMEALHISHEEIGSLKPEIEVLLL